jgi:glyoxylase-like metal-dependent hydrolase (beta-lactamase superfamily II)
MGGVLPVAAGEWFVREQTESAITRLLEPYVAPLLRCNVWHVRGRERDLLVDTGLGVASLLAAARDLFGRPLVVVLTHTHRDHMGGAHEFADVRVHEAELEAARGALDPLPLDVATWPPALHEALAAAGYPTAEGLLTARPSAEFALDAPLLAVRGAQALREGDALDLGDRRFEVLHLPGHSPGSIGLWDPRSATLFSGDAIYDGPLLDDIPGANRRDYARTMERLLALPVRVVHAGHDPSFGRARLVEIARGWLARRAPRPASA